MSKYVDITISDKSEADSLPVLEGTLGPAAVDIQSLYARENLLAFDPGFRSTASCRSAITFVDGDNGVLLYRGYPIEELADHSTFEDVAFLLMNGELPNAEQRKDFVVSLHRHNLLHE